MLGGTKALKLMYGVPKKNNEFRIWISRKVILEMIEKQATKCLNDLVEVTQASRPSIREYFEEVKMEGRKHLYVSLWNIGSTTQARARDANPDPPQLDVASYRLVYRTRVY